MKSLHKKTAILLLLAAACTQLYAQDSPATEPAAAYYDFLFDDYIELETSVLEKYSSGTLESWELGVISSFRQGIEDSGRDDILSRIDMLMFIVEAEVKEKRKTQNAEEVIAGISAAEKAFRKEAAVRENLRKGSGFAIGTAAVAGGVFAAASLLSNDFYSKYTQAELADQAAFHLFWFQTLDRIALAGALTGLISGAAAAVMAALY